ncbi:hypothetical protein AVEN_210139-1 [Araneus ventricosus]|uniref:Uncharacterized protein n=1 Tax=Araneus ventricosus TaxID=182803 RepID=A0A4Y2SPZ7_ARAVE|nr:hypothetical protein AVEN_210139-1 [Araneus ventricosus]
MRPGCLIQMDQVWDVAQGASDHYFKPNLIRLMLTSSVMEVVRRIRIQTDANSGRSLTKWDAAQGHPPGWFPSVNSTNGSQHPFYCKPTSTTRRRCSARCRLSGLQAGIPSATGATRPGRSSKWAGYQGGAAIHRFRRTEFGLLMLTSSMGVGCYKGDGSSANCGDQDVYPMTGVSSPGAKVIHATPNLLGVYVDQAVAGVGCLYWTICKLRDAR